MNCQLQITDNKKYQCPTSVYKILWTWNIEQVEKHNVDNMGKKKTLQQKLVFNKFSKLLFNKIGQLESFIMKMNKKINT